MSENIGRRPRLPEQEQAPSVILGVHGSELPPRAFTFELPHVPAQKSALTIGVWTREEWERVPAHLRPEVYSVTPDGEFYGTGDVNPQ